MNEYLNNLVELFKECLRVTKTTGSIIWNVGDKYLKGALQLAPYRFAIKVMDETEATLINNINWVKTNPVPRQFKRRMISSHEPFFHFVKSNQYKYYENRLTENKKLTPQPQTKIGRKYFKIIDKSELKPLEKENAKKDLNVAIQEVKDGKIAGLRMKIRGIHAMAFGGQEGGRNNQIINNGYSIIRLLGNSMLKDTMESPVESIQEDHPAIFPCNLIEKLIKLTTDEDDLVLDPFMGSGTTAVACKKLKRSCIGFELYDKYVKQINNRIENGG